MHIALISKCIDFSIEYFVLNNLPQLIDIFSLLPLRHINSPCSHENHALGLKQELNLKIIRHGRLGILIGLLCPTLYANEIDLKLTTSDGSTQMSVDNAAAASVASIDSAGNLKFNSSLMPNGQPGTAGQVLQSNGSGAVPIWIPSLLVSTSTWTAQQTYSQGVTVSSNLVVTNGGVISGNGSGLTNLLPGSITTGIYSGITGIGAQSQNLNLNLYLINNLGTPATGTDAATKAYVDAATTTANATLIISPNTWTAPQTYSDCVKISSNLVVTNGGIINGNGSGLTNLPLASITAGVLPTSVVASSIAANTVYPAAVTSGVYSAITGLGAMGQNLNMNSNLINFLGTPAVGTDAATKAYVDAATTSVNTTLLMSTITWTGQQTYTKQITVSTSMALSGALITGGSAGTSGQLLQSQGSGSAPAWISSTTFLGGTPILRQGSASLSLATKTAGYQMTPADFAILGDATSGAITINLPAASNAGMLVFVAKKDSSVNYVNIAPSGSDTIVGSATPINLTTQFYKRMLIADGGSNWYVISQ
jgi:hypothetical protein